MVGRAVVPFAAIRPRPRRAARRRGHSVGKPHLLACCFLTISGIGYKARRDRCEDFTENLARGAQRTECVAEARTWKLEERTIGRRARFAGSKLLQAHLAGAVPLDLLGEQQERITRQLGNARITLAQTEIDWSVVAANVDEACKLVTNVQEAYRKANPAVRRLFNQAIFESIAVDVDGAIYTRLAEPFADMLAADFATRLEDVLANPAPVSLDDGSNKRLLVDLIGCISNLGIVSGLQSVLAVLVVVTGRPLEPFDARSPASPRRARLRLAGEVLR